MSSLKFFHGQVSDQTGGGWDSDLDDGKLATASLTKSLKARSGMSVVRCRAAKGIRTTRLGGQGCGVRFRGIPLGEPHLAALDKRMAAKSNSGRHHVLQLPVTQEQQRRTGPVVQEPKPAYPF